MNALLITTDLMALSAAEGAATRAGARLKTAAPKVAVTTATELSPRVVAIDLTASIADLPALVDGLREAAPEVTLVAYGPHVHEAKLQAAKAAGCDLVISRGQFHKGFAEILAQCASDTGGPA